MEDISFKNGRTSTGKGVLAVAMWRGFQAGEDLVG